MSMDDTILRRLCNVALGDHENTCLQLDDHDIDEGLKEDALSVFIHIHGGKHINLGGSKSAMGKAWRCGSFSIQRVDDLFYQIYFDTKEMVDFVLHNGPWNFENTLVQVRSHSSSSPNLYQDLDKEYFWLHLTGLPRYCYTMEEGHKLAKVLDSSQTMQLREDRVIDTKFFRFRMLIHIARPLQRILHVHTPDGSMHAGLLKYERLPTFCLCCGLIGHRYTTCERLKNETVDVTSFLYGSWMAGVDNVIS